MFTNKTNFDDMQKHLTSLAECLQENYNREKLLIYPKSKRCSGFWKGNYSEWSVEALAKFQAASIFSTDKFARLVFNEGCEGAILLQVLEHIATKKDTKAIDVFRSKESTNNGLYESLLAKSKCRGDNSFICE